MADEAAPVVVENVEAPTKPVFKERIQRLPKPDRTILDGQVGKLQAQCDKCQERINEIKKLIEGKRNNRRNVSSGSQMARTALAELKSQFQSALVWSSKSGFLRSFFSLFFTHIGCWK